MVDTFQGPPKKQGVIGRLVLDRALANYGFDITIAVSGLSSESLSLYAEGVDGSIVGEPTIYRNTNKVIENPIQNGVFTIRIDDIKPGWDNIVFIKSGSLDRVKLDIESMFDYVEAR